MLDTLSSRGDVGARSASAQASRTTGNRNRVAQVKDRRYRQQVVLRGHEWKEGEGLGLYLQRSSPVARVTCMCGDIALLPHCVQALTQSPPCHNLTVNCRERTSAWKDGKDGTPDGTPARRISGSSTLMSTGRIDSISYRQRPFRGAELEPSIQ